MKIYTKVVIDMNSMEVEDEESFEYEGPLALAGGGGSNSGSVDLPAHITQAHTQWLNHAGADVPSRSWVSLFNERVTGDNPYELNPPNDPSDRLTAMATSLTRLEAAVDTISDNANITTVLDNFFDEAYIVAAGDAFDDSMQLRYESETIPRFEAGMRDINAVMSSSFVLGKGIIESNRQREVANYEGAIRAKRDIEFTFQLMTTSIQYETTLNSAADDVEKTGIMAENDSATSVAEWAYKEKRYAPDLYITGGNLIAAVSGGVAMQDNGPTKGQAAIGGAASGAAAGAQVGGGYGALIGGIIGGVAGYASA